MRVKKLSDENKIKMTRKAGKKRKENPVGCTGECKKTVLSLKFGGQKGII